ncbi:MAG: NUDIX hydrolase [Parcubacteria group bacterium GW2011_GWE2_39_37]|uniref:NUDIX hydrolase n=1 Tax=Candidatus Falkowbacteria bacterium GW2011_GWF2_39_8 TaxID=1618642 RepID=A0A0G0PWL6_9BACT|nr:MAG: NUDIX hydrolase [Parcubacteria group bacterium GW2011_GWE2_39_37]KKR32569.1 MAG: NUDIX hydrolase [Candidatus Falkowbacteria bacterium GW2011_GWF2_39_8]
MAYFNKIGLLLLNDKSSKFLVCEKNNFTSDFIMPGGQVDEGENDVECLVREIKEELDVDTDKSSLVFIKDYIDVAAGDPTKDVSIKLYQGKIIGEPKPSMEIIKFHWIGKDDLTHSRLSPIIKNKILPDLIERDIIK